MGGQGQRASHRPVCIGLLAHVDAGKTTLAEGILYLNGKLRKLGRVDHKDAFLDTYELERARGITIFSKQALVTLGDWEVTLLDTPGHVDFSAEMERVLQVLDLAVLIISGADGVQGHVETLWRLLGQYQVPTVLFLNKMDQPGTDRARLLSQVQKQLDERCVDFDEAQDGQAFLENLSMCEVGLMEEYLESGKIEDSSIRRSIGRREVFPCFFGSALRLTGVEEFLRGLERYLPESGKASDAFGARVYKISRDAQGTRLTHMKVTGGSLKVKSLVSGEKVDQIRIYDGDGYQLAEEAGAGTVCAVTGLDETFCGQGLGTEKERTVPLLEPVLTYRVHSLQESDPVKLLGQLRRLEEEIPELHIVWKEASREIHAQVMGEVQIEILQSLIRERFGVSVAFDAGSIVYKETIAAPVEGVGHFEPLRHYAEVHLLLEPGEPGSGMQFSSACSEDVLDRNWQRLILTHLEERRHVGVLTGSEVTDLRIVLVAGRAHQKHTEGGDFRQATYRAVRQGLRKARSILLEPVYEFTLEVPTEALGRAITDIQRMQGSIQAPQSQDGMSLLRGKAPVATMQGYQTEVVSYTHGRGRLHCLLGGYEPCHNAEEVIARIGYDPEADLDNPTGSVFCAHGAGFVVSWDQVDSYAHVESGLSLEKEEPQGEGGAKGVMPSDRSAGGAAAGGSAASKDAWIDEEELEEIFTRTYGPIKRDRNRFGQNRDRSRMEPDLSVRQSFAGSGMLRTRTWEARADQEEYLLVDGYNIIFAWEDLKELAQANIDSARSKLMDVLCNYQGFRQNTVILVFDAYKVKGNPGSVEKYHNIYVVYTKEAETADQYIEKTVHRIGQKYRVTVATSDALEQMIIWGEGAARLSAKGLKEEIASVEGQIRETAREKLPKKGNYPFRDMSEKFRGGSGT